MATNKPITRQCKAKNAAGKPCRIKPMRGEDYCNAHHPNLPESSRFTGGAKPGAGRPRIERPTEIATRLMEEQLEPIIRRQISLALSEHVDPNVSTKNAQYLTNRVLGVPTQRTEVTGAGGGPVSIAHLILSLDDAAEASQSPSNGTRPDIREDGQVEEEPG